VASYKVEPLSRDELDETLRSYVCSTCWGELSFKFIDGKRYAICPMCGEETVGYTSRSYAEYQRQQSEHEVIEAEHNLRKIMNLRKTQSTEKNLQDLGYGNNRQI